ncbi:MAG: site-specific DNA-methyltransferase [Nitrososphaerota archaeon]|nr:site-specific DNA-methyltransferase [Nitrososphaerota archaeon]
MTSNCRVIQGDVLEVLRSFDDNTFGAVITDPPYATGGLHVKERQAPTAAKYTANKTKNPLPNFEGDSKDQLSWILWCTTWLREAKRVCKQGAPICVFIDFRQLDALKLALQWADWLVRGVVVWDKTESTQPQRGRFRNQCEFILWGSKGAMSLNRNVPVLKGCYRYPTLNQNKLHQTQKPLALMRDIIKICEPEEIILDPFCGSGTTLIAALHEGYNAIGIEVTKEYATIAQKQITDTQNNHNHNNSNQTSSATNNNSNKETAR